MTDWNALRYFFGLKIKRCEHHWKTIYELEDGVLEQCIFCKTVQVKYWEVTQTTVGKLSCWNRDCPEDSNTNETCIKQGCVNAKGCKNWMDSPWNEEMNKQ